MEKERRIKTISAIALIVAVLGLTVAFAVLSTNLVINGTAKVDPGTWNIYFENLLQTNLKGKAQIENSASIDDNDKTRINNMNVILKQPKDEVIYTVELKNDGDIDAEISRVTVPQLSEDEKKYIEFNATYADKKPITEGDILRGKTKEDVTISIKFKEDVTTLPESDLIVSLSYEINYVQTDKKVEDNVHNGEVSIPKIDYENLSQGSTVSLGEEEFYVIENNVSELKLLAKYNLFVGNNVTINDLEDIGEFKTVKKTPIDKSVPGYGIQNSNAKGGLLDQTSWVGAVGFIKPEESKKKDPSCQEDWGCYNGYWVDENSSFSSKYTGNYPYVYDENSNLYSYLKSYKDYLESLRYNINEVRLMKRDELLELGFDPDKGNNDSAPKWLFETTYWLGNADPEDNVKVFLILGEDLVSLESDVDFMAGIRPVVVLNKN